MAMVTALRSSIIQRLIVQVIVAAGRHGLNFINFCDLLASFLVYKSHPPEPREMLIIYLLHN